MRRLLLYIICMPMLLLSSCDVYEWPEAAPTAKVHLRLHFNTAMTRWEHLYDGVQVKEQGLADTYDNCQAQGQIRYIVRTYPASGKQRSLQDCNYTQEFVFTKNMADGYDHDVTLNILPGSYDIMVWADMTESAGDSYFYDAGNFSEIRLQGAPRGSTDHRDAFRGTGSITVVTDNIEHAPDTLDVEMQRPMAKLELITTDLQKFIDKQMQLLSKDPEKRGDNHSIKVDLKTYRIVFQYAGFMPDTYNMFINKPIDSSMGVMFESKMTVLNDNEASLGFDYVFVNGQEAGVSLQIGLYDAENKQLAFSEPITVPLRRNRHTVLRGSFLMQQASGGITIDSDFDGNHNIVIE